MGNVSNVSSEAELLQLRDEGKISEADYQDLLGAMKKTVKVDIAHNEQNEPKPFRTSGLAIASFTLSALGTFILVIGFSIISILVPFFGPFIFIPGIICGHLARREIKKDPTIGGTGMALAGLIIGYIFLALFAMLFFVWYNKTVEVKRASKAAEVKQDVKKIEDIQSTGPTIKQAGHTQAMLRAFLIVPEQDLQALAKSKTALLAHISHHQ